MSGQRWDKRMDGRIPPGVASNRSGEVDLDAALAGSPDTGRNEPASGDRPTTEEARPACEGDHDPRHWKRGQSPRATHRVTLRDGWSADRQAFDKEITQNLCKRCLADERRWGNDVVRAEVIR